MCALVVRSLPAPLNSLVAPTFLGFALINTFTFGVDLAILTALHGALRTPLPVAVTVGYAVAFGLAYYLNRTLNFRSHAAVGPQLTVYVLAALGVEYHLARIVAGGCEALFMYSAMRWVVFR